MVSMLEFSIILDKTNLYVIVEVLQESHAGFLLCLFPWKLAVVFSVGQLLGHLQRVLETHEVNWKHVLCFLSTLLVYEQSAQSSLKGESREFVGIKRAGFYCLKPFNRKKILQLDGNKLCLCWDFLKNYLTFFRH